MSRKRRKSGKAGTPAEARKINLKRVHTEMVLGVKSAQKQKKNRARKKKKSLSVELGGTKKKKKTFAQ